MQTPTARSGIPVWGGTGPAPCPSRATSRTQAGSQATPYVGRHCPPQIPASFPQGAPTDSTAGGSQGTGVQLRQRRKGPAGRGGADSLLCRASRQDGRLGSCGDRHAEASPRHGPGQASSQTGFPRREWAARRRACATAADPSPASANAAPRSVPGARGGRTRTPLSRRSGNSDAARGPRRGAPGRVAAPAERKSRGYCRRLLPTGTRGHGDSPYSFSFCSPRTLSPKNQNDGFPCRGKDAHLLPGRASAGE